MHDRNHFPVELRPPTSYASSRGFDLLCDVLLVAVQGTGSIDVDLVGFCAICEAAAAGDREASEFADMSVEEFQSLAGAAG